MPISRSEFERGEINPYQAVMSFLRLNKDYAWTLEEIQEKVHSQYKLTIGIEELRNFLDELAMKGIIEKKEICGVIYYCWIRLGLVKG